MLHYKTDLITFSNRVHSNQLKNVFRNPSHKTKICLFSISVFEFRFIYKNHEETDCVSKKQIQNTISEAVCLSNSPDSWRGLMTSPIIAWMAMQVTLFTLSTSTNASMLFFTEHGS